MSEEGIKKAADELISVHESEQNGDYFCQSHEDVRSHEVNETKEAVNHAIITVKAQKKLSHRLYAKCVYDKDLDIISVENIELSLILKELEGRL